MTTPDAPRRRVNGRRIGAVVAIVAVIAAVILLFATGTLQFRDSSTTSTSATTSTSQPAETSESEVEEEPEETARVESPSGLEDVPLDDGPNVVGDSTNDPDVRPLVDTIEQCGGIWDSWDDVITCKGDDEDYMNRFDLFAADLGFDRGDVERWAAAVPGYNAQYILVANWPEMEDPANARAKLVSEGFLTLEQANNLPVRVENCFMNTREKESNDPGKFADCRKSQVRVTLAPLVLEHVNGKPNVVKALLGSGVFSDCGNQWWRIVFRHYVSPPPPPAPSTTVVTTTTHPPTTTRPPWTPPTTTPPTTPPPTTTQPPPSTTSKPSTTNPQAPEGITPLPTYGPSHTAPTPAPSNPAPPPDQLPTSAPVSTQVVVPDATSVPRASTPAPLPELPSNPPADMTTTPDQPVSDGEIVDPGSAPAP